MKEYWLIELDASHFLCESGDPRGYWNTNRSNGSAERLLDFYFPEDVEHKIATVRCADMHGLREQFEERLRRSDGAELWVGMSGRQPDCARIQAVRWGLAMVADITERRRAEEALRKVRKSCRRSCGQAQR